MHMRPSHIVGIRRIPTDGLAASWARPAALGSTKPRRGAVDGRIGSAAALLERLET